MWCYLNMLHYQMPLENINHVFVLKFFFSNYNIKVNNQFHINLLKFISMKNFTRIQFS